MWGIVLAWLTSQSDSDAAGNAMTQGFTALGLIVVWVLLAVFALFTGLAGKMPLWAAIVAVVMVPASGYAAFLAQDLLGDPRSPPYYWPIMQPALVPPLIVLFCVWALAPRLRSAIPAVLAGGVAWGAVLILCLAIVPMGMRRDADDERVAAAAAKAHAEFVALPPDAPLWRWTPFLVMNGLDLDDALRHIQKLDRRQADAEIMLARGDFPPRYLGFMELQPTAAICDKARAALRRRATPLILATPQSRPYLDIWLDVDAAASAMEWLAKNHCAIAEEARAWETMASAYRDPNFDVVRLKELSDGTR